MSGIPETPPLIVLIQVSHTSDMIPGAIFSNFSISSLKKLFCIRLPLVLVTEDAGLVGVVISKDLLTRISVERTHV